jgi:hypothetical protein
MRIRGLPLALAAIPTAALAVALLHLPQARSLLQRAGGCPLPRATAAQVEAAQAGAFAKLRGGTNARTMPALGFGLAIATRDDLERWAREHGVGCDSRREGTFLICAEVPASAVSKGAHGTYDELAFGFRVRDLRLVNVTALRTGLSGEAAASELRGIAARLETALGPATHAAAGDPAVVAHRHADYLAEASAMSLRGRGHALREHYMTALE